MVGGGKHFISDIKGYSSQNILLYSVVKVVTFVQSSELMHALSVDVQRYTLVKLEPE